MEENEEIKYLGHTIIKRTTYFMRPVDKVTEYVVLGRDFDSLAAAKRAVKQYEKMMGGE